MYTIFIFPHDLQMPLKNRYDRFCGTQSHSFAWILMPQGIQMAGRRQVASGAVASNIVELGVAGGIYSHPSIRKLAMNSKGWRDRNLGPDAGRDFF